MYLLSFESIKKNYDGGYWTKEQLYKVTSLAKPPITHEQYEEITGESYESYVAAV